MSLTSSKKRNFFSTQCKLEYKNNEKMLLDAINRINVSELLIIKSKINAINSVIILKECLILYDKCLKNYNEENFIEYGKNVKKLEESLDKFNSEKFMRYSEFRRDILTREFPTFDEKELIDKLQVLQTGDIIPFDKLPKGFLELLQCESKKTARGSKKKLKTNKQKLNFKKLKKHITRRLKPRIKIRSKPKKNKPKLNKTKKN
jgi:hypothetical protein